MIIAAWNINNINRRMANLLAWLRGKKPDVVCLQELKARQHDFPTEAIADGGYGAVCVAEKSWNGAAIVARGTEPVLTRRRLPGDDGDTQSRYVEAAVNGILIASIYAPNGNPQPGPKFDYKLAWLDRLHRHATMLRKSGAPVVLAGDFNVAPVDLDIYPTRSWDNDALVRPESRAAFKRLLGRSWTDALRAMHPDERIYTFWHYLRNRWQRDAGLRIDHLLLSQNLSGRLQAAGVDREERGKQGASDHAPVWIRLAKQGCGTNALGRRLNRFAPEDNAMAAPAFWKGYLKLSLVTCPISMTPATTEGEKVRFHTINRKTGRRVRSRYIDAETEKPVNDEDQVKGYETSSDQFVTFEDEDFEAVAVDSVRTIDIDQFAPADSVPWIFYDRPYYVTPNDKVGDEAYAVIRDAMADKGVVGISRVVLFRRERAVMLQPRDNGIILWTLRYGEEVREPEGYFKGIDQGKSDPKLLRMITQLIDKRAVSWDASMVHDPVQEQLKDLIAERRKKQGKSRKKAADVALQEPQADNVIDLLSALKKSLEKPGAKAQPAKK